MAAESRSEVFDSQAQVLKDRKRKRKKNTRVSVRGGWLRKGWHKSKSQEGLQNVDLTLKVEKKSEIALHLTEVVYSAHN